MPGLRGVVEDLSSVGERLAGYREERWAERLRGLVESVLGVQAEAERVPVYYWRVGSVEVDPPPRFAVAAPYASGDVEARWAWVEGDPGEWRSWRGFPEGRVAVARMPGDPDDLKAAALHAWEAGASALVLESPVPRKIVGVGCWGYSWHAGEPLPIPVAVVGEGWHSRLPSNGRVRVAVEAEEGYGWGYNIIAREGGPPRIAFGAHHDGWFTGVQDNLLGIAQALAAAREALERGAGGVEVILFTAEEHGAPGPAGWYWAWGSRWHARQLEASNIDGVSVYVNFDLAGGGRLHVSGAPQRVGRALEALKAAGVEAGVRGWECPECDSLSLAMAGVETVSIHSLWAPGVRGYYHTPLDTVERVDWRAAEAAVEAAVRSAMASPDYGRLETALHELLAPGPLEARMILYEILSAARRHGWQRLYPEMAKRHLRPLHMGDYRLDGPAEMEACMFPEVCGLRDERIGEVRAVIVPGEERLLYRPRGRLGDQVRSLLDDLLWRVRGWLREL